VVIGEFMRFDGSISVEIEEFGRYSVRDSKKSNGLIYVPKEAVA